MIGKGGGGGSVGEGGEDWWKRVGFIDQDDVISEDDVIFHPVWQRVDVAAVAGEQMGKVASVPGTSSCKEQTQK